MTEGNTLCRFLFGLTVWNVSNNYRGTLKPEEKTELIKETELKSFNFVTPYLKFTEKLAEIKARDDVRRNVNE